MKRLIYTSRARPTLREDALSQILASSRDANRTRQVTGLLAYADDRFLQVLEGEAEALMESYARIRRDWRHDTCQILFHETVPARMFTGWPLAFRGQKDLEPRQRRQFADIKSMATEATDTQKATDNPSMDVCLRAFIDSFSELSVQ